jgi:hypothetical protein
VKALATAREAENITNNAIGCFIFCTSSAGDSSAPLRQRFEGRAPVVPDVFRFLAKSIARRPEIDRLLSGGKSENGREKTESPLRGNCERTCER